MKCITVLDFEIGKVFQYEVMRQEGWNPDSESIEDFLESEGHNINNLLNITITIMSNSNKSKKQNNKYKVNKQSDTEAQAIFAMIQMEKQRKANNPPAAWPNNNRDGLD